jgi:Concanavalin A-like lectin/glucanases superfamily
VATKSGGTIKIYIDGVDRTGTVTNRTIANNSSALNIGRYTSGTQHFPGLIDELAIYNTPLSEAQVQQHFRASGR